MLRQDLNAKARLESRPIDLEKLERSIFPSVQIEEALDLYYAKYSIRRLIVFTYTLFLGFCIFLEVEADLIVPCPVDWHISKDSGSCFRLFNQSKTWDDARTECKSQNADLLKIIDQWMNVFVADLVQTQSDTYWIGLIRREKDGPWYWLDEREKANYLYMAYLNQDPFCGLMNDPKHTKLSWGAKQCNMTAFYICQTFPQKDLCDEGWIANSVTKSCIKLHRNPSSWQEARMTCQDQGGDLAVIPDSTTNSFMHDQVMSDPNSPTYFGLNDLKTEGKFANLDFHDEINFTNWNTLQPNDQRQGKTLSEDCVVFNFKGVIIQGGWDDVACETKNIFVCEKYSDCANEQYGMLCPVSCNETNCGGPEQKCNKRTGSCISCAPGYLGLTCIEKCGNGTFGLKCKQKCSENCAGKTKSCNHIDGKCDEGCVPPFTGDQCNDDPDDYMMIIVVVVVVGALLLVIILIIVISSIRKKAPRAEPDAAPKEDAPVEEPPAAEELPEIEETIDGESAVDPTDVAPNPEEGRSQGRSSKESKGSDKTVKSETEPAPAET